METGIIIVSLIGLLLSIYSYYVELKTKKNPKYHALCDINSKVSCGKTFASKYGKLIDGVSNSLGGIFFYAFVILILLFNLNVVIFGFTLVQYSIFAAIIGSVYLAYLQYFRIRLFCLVCSSIYVVNILLLLMALHIL